MCGIAGLLCYAQGSVCPTDTPIRMRDVMAYRGPDDCGVHVDGQIGLAHRRLSIIDLGGGHQPMSNENGSLVGFDEPDYDESAYAVLVSQQYGTTHHQLCLTNVEFSELFPQMVWHNDEPLNFANSVQIFALSRLAKTHVTVVLTGEGSDELFAGYPRYGIPGLAASYRRLPAVVRRLLKGWGRWTKDHRVDKIERFAACSPEDTLIYNASLLRPEVVAVACPRLPGFDLDYRRECLRGTEGLGSDAAARLSLLDQETFLGLHPQWAGQDEHGGRHRVPRSLFGLPNRRVGESVADRV